MSDTHLRNLPVPFFSQRQNDYTLKEYYTSDVYDDKTNKLLHKEGDLKREISMDCRTCNITSVMMIMKYLGLTEVERTVGDKTFITPKTPKEFLVKYFNRDYDLLFPDTDKPTYGVACLEDWKNLKRIAKYVFNADCRYYGSDNKSFTLSDLKEEIATGYPVCISIGMEKNSDGSYKREGHVVVVRGFTKIGTTEYVILNDPWGSIADDEFNVYEISDKTSLGSYYYGRDNDSRTSGDNVIVKLSDFRSKLVMGTSTGAETGTYFHNAMTIHAPLWDFPDGTNDFTTEEKQADIYGKIRHLNGGYPLNKNNVWHTGVHLGIDGNIHSIGPGSLIAVRNSEAVNDSYDKSFVLLEHKIKSNNDIKTFYSLYMHLKHMDLKEIVKNYFSKGEKSPYSWLNQLLNKMLCYSLVVKNFDSDSGAIGQINESYKSIKLYKVNILEDGTLIKESAVSSKILGRRCLITPLPVKNQKIHPKLLDLQKYNDEDFKSDMQSVKTYRYDNFLYFYLDGKLYATKYNESYFEYRLIFYKQLLTTAKQIYNLAEGKVVTFSNGDDYIKINVEQKLKESLKEKKDRLSVTLQSRFTGIADSESLQLDMGNPFLDIIDLCSFASGICCNTNELKTIQTLYEQNMDSYSKTYGSELKKFLTVLENNNKSVKENAPKEQILNQVKNWKIYLQETCVNILKEIEEKLNIKINIPQDLTNTKTARNGKELIDLFVQEINKTKLSYSNKIIVYETLILWLEKIPADSIENYSYFESSDFSIDLCKEIIISKNGLINSLKMIYNGTFTYFLENQIEIGKNEVLGNCGKYETLLLDNKGKETYLTEPQIHFEIFSEEKNVLDFEKEIIDIDSDILYNPKQCIEDGKDIIKEEADKYEKGLEYLDDNMLKLEELDSLYKLTNNSFLNEVALNIKSQWAEKENKTKYKFYNKKYQIVEETDDVGKLRKRKKIIEYDDYYNKVIKPFMWFSPNVFGGNHFRDGNAWFYHPLYFIEKLAKMELDEKKT